ncbi:profilin-4-like [Styela clava]
MAELWMEGDRYQIKGVPDRVKLNQLNNLLHDALISTEHVEKCAIVDRREAEQKAASVGFMINKSDIQSIQEAFKNTSISRKEGIVFEGKNYKCIRADKNSIYAKSGHRGLVVARNNTILIVATYNKQMYPSVCVEAVEKLADYFREKGR